jgi:hypothetical protein
LSNVKDPNSSIGESICSVSTEASIAVKSMCEALGGPRVIVAAKREDEHQSRLSEQSISMQTGNQSFSPNQSSLGIVLPECLRQPSVSSLRMPDTPIKKPIALHKAHPQINKPLIPSGLRQLSSSYSPSIGGSPVDNSPTSRGHQLCIPESPIPQFHSRFQHDPPCLIAPNGSTADGSSSSWTISGDADPSPSLSRANTSGQVTSGLESLGKQSPVYRRRSSDGVPSNQSGHVNLSKTSSSRQSNPFDDPGTPTKAATTWLKRGESAYPIIMLSSFS